MNEGIIIYYVRISLIIYTTSYHLANNGTLFCTFVPVFFLGPGAGLVILELIPPIHILKRATR